jgi:hypothetical protein
LINILTLIMAIAQKKITHMHETICGTICIEKVFVNCKI